MQQAKGVSAPKIIRYDDIAGRMQAIFDNIARRAYDIFESNGRQWGHDIEDWFKAEKELLHPVQISVAETDQALEIKAEVPGFNEKELEISVEPQRLTITGKHESSKKEKKGKTVYSEIRASNIFRSIDLPVEVNAAQAVATLKDGVLSLTIPKSVKAQAVRVKAAAA